ncbi:MAG TPA: hypothetical protein VGL86_15120 [Polyangia bacterium]|jgi:hypothetical protein
MQERAVAIVVLVDGVRRDVAAGAIAAAAMGLGAWLVSAHVLVAAIALALAFPVAARLSRSLRIARLRRQFARDPALAARREAEALARATPGQRAALIMITKPPA